MRLIPALAFLALLASGPAVPGKDAAAEAQGTGFVETNGTIAVGQAAPAILGESLDGRAITAESTKGRPVLLDFSSIFCPSCQETIREFRRLQDDYKDTDLALVIVVDGDTPAKVLKNFFTRSGATHTVIRDRENGLFDRYGVKNIPFQVAIDRKGVIRRIHVGFDPGMEAAMGLKELTRK